MTQDNPRNLINAVEDALFDFKRAEATLEEQRVRMEQARALQAQAKDRVEASLTLAEGAGFNKRTIKQLADDRLSALINSDLIKITPLPLDETSETTEAPVTQVRTRQPRQKKAELQNSVAEPTTLSGAGVTTDNAEQVAEVQEQGKASEQADATDHQEMMEESHQDSALHSILSEQLQSDSTQEVDDEPEDAVEDGADAASSAEPVQTAPAPVQPAPVKRAVPNTPPVFLTSRRPIPVPFGNNSNGS